MGKQNLEKYHNGATKLTYKLDNEKKIERTKDQLNKQHNERIKPNTD